METNLIYAVQSSFEKVVVEGISKESPLVFIRKLQLKTTIEEFKHSLEKPELLDTEDLSIISKDTINSIFWATSIEKAEEVKVEFEKVQLELLKENFVQWEPEISNFKENASSYDLDFLISNYQSLVVDMKLEETNHVAAFYISLKDGVVKLGIQPNSYTHDEEGVTLRDFDLEEVDVLDSKENQLSVLVHASNEGLEEIRTNFYAFDVEVSADNTLFVKAHINYVISEFEKIGKLLLSNFPKQ